MTMSRDQVIRQVSDKFIFYSSYNQRVKLKAYCMAGKWGYVIISYHNSAIFHLNFATCCLLTLPVSSEIFSYHQNVDLFFFSKQSHFHFHSFSNPFLSVQHTESEATPVITASTTAHSQRYCRTKNSSLAPKASHNPYIQCSALQHFKKKKSVLISQYTVWIWPSCGARHTTIGSCGVAGNTPHLH